MAGKTNTLSLAYNISNALFQAWVADFIDTMTTGGWLQTTDTGQINPATVANPLANTMAGYAIFKSNDASGGLVNIYLRVEFWGISNTSGMVGFGMQIGYATDGAGNLTGVVSPKKFNYSTSTSSADSNYAASGSGWLVYQYGISTRIKGYSLERLYNNNGQLTNDILFMTWNYTGSILRSQQVLTPTLLYPENTSTAMAVYPTGVNSVKNARCGVGFIFGQKAGLTNPSVNLMVNIERTNGQPNLGQTYDTVAIRNQGTSHTYIMFSGDINGYSLLGGSGLGIYMRYE